MISFNNSIKLERLDVVIYENNKIKFFVTGFSEK